MKTSSLRGPSVALLLVLSPVCAHAGLTCDLNAGSLNTLQIGRPAAAAALAAALGGEPGRVDEDFPAVTGYLFPDKGVEVDTANDGDVVRNIWVYYTAGTDFYDAPVARYQGGFVPALGQHETVSSIKGKLGVPAKEYLPAAGVSEPSTLIYRRPFGKIDFLFGVDGSLRNITLSALGPLDEGWAAPPKKSEAPARAEPAPSAPIPQKALFRDPAAEARALDLRVRELLKAGKSEQAVADLEAALKQNPRNWNAVGLLMEASFARGDHDRVIAEAQGILRLNPKNGFARQMRGRSLLAERRWEEAAAEFAELIKLEPGSADAYAGRAKAELESGTPFNSGHYKAYDDYAKAVSLSTPTAQLLYEKGGAARKCGMFAVAQGDYFQAATLAPERVDILLAKAETELLLWRQDKASNWYFSAQVTITQARRLAPESEEVRVLAARIMSETPH